MAAQFGFNSLGWRFLLAFVIVMLSFNPSGWSFWHWATAQPLSLTPGKALVGISLLIGWVVLLRATISSLGMFGLVLAGSLFGCLVWGLVYWGLISIDNTTVLTWVVELVAILILTAGLSWSHVRRRLSGQQDVDEIETN